MCNLFIEPENNHHPKKNGQRKMKLKSRLLFSTAVYVSCAPQCVQCYLLLLHFSTRFNRYFISISIKFFSLFCFSWSIPITYLFCADRTGCWCRWKTMSGNEKKMLDKMKQSFSEIKAAHWKLFNQNLSGCNGLNKSVLTSIVIFAAH